MTLVQKFIVISFIAMLLFGSLLGLLVTTALEHSMLKRAEQITASFVSGEIARELKGIDFRNPITGRDYYTFAIKAKHLNLGPNVLNRNIWNKQMRIVWSDDIRLVGQRFPQHKGVKKALAGEIVSEVSTLAELEKKYKITQRFDKVLELYIPIRFDAKGAVEAVFELYQDLDLLYIDLSRFKFIVWVSIVGSTALLYTLLTGIVINISRRYEARS